MKTSLQGILSVYRDFSGGAQFHCTLQTSWRCSDPVISLADFLSEGAVMLFPYTRHYSMLSLSTQVYIPN